MSEDDRILGQRRERCTKGHNLSGEAWHLWTNISSHFSRRKVQRILESLLPWTPLICLLRVSLLLAREGTSSGFVVQGEKHYHLGKRGPCMCITFLESVFAACMQAVAPVCMKLFWGSIILTLLMVFDTRSWKGDDAVSCGIQESGVHLSSAIRKRGKMSS